MSMRRPFHTSALGLLGAIVALAGPMAARGDPAPERLTHGRFENISVHRPAGTPTSAVLLLSGGEGWNAEIAASAEALSSHGALVVGIDWPKLEANLEADGADCVFPDGDLENLSHFVQAYYHVPSYLPPFLVGYRDSASLAYATLVQAPADTFAGALTVGFSAATSLRKPLCKGSGVEYAHAAGKPEFLAAARLASPWVTFESDRAGGSGSAQVAEFVARIPGAAMVRLPGAAADAWPSRAWLPPFLAAFDVLAARAAAKAGPATPHALGDLPVIEVPAQTGVPPGDSFALILSGDGGWAGLDKDVAQALAAHGIPVAGLDSLRYFWGPRTPAGLASDLDRMVRYYLAHFAKKRALLIGYSQGADVLPFALDRMPESTLSTIGLAVLMGMSEHALFEFHVTSWISNDTSGPATMPEVNRISGIPILCIYGEGDDDSLCPKLDSRKVKVVKLPGGHHFDGDYARLAQEILAAAGP
jgi:type IV secretory pathway VirJ component